MDSKQNLLQVIDVYAGAKSLTAPLERMFLDHCYLDAQHGSHTTEVVVAYEAIKEIIERSFEFGIDEESKITIKS